MIQALAKQADGHVLAPAFIALSFWVLLMWIGSRGSKRLFVFGFVAAIATILFLTFYLEGTGNG